MRCDFEAFADSGRKLAKWDLEYESVEPWPLTWVYSPGVPLSYEVTKMKLSKDKTTPSSTTRSRWPASRQRSFATA
jgi:predicted helicase